MVRPFSRELRALLRPTSSSDDAAALTRIGGRHALLAISGALAIGIGLGGCGSAERFPNTPLFEGITDGDYERGQRLIRERVEERFKVGDSEVGLEDFLRSQGLTTRRMENSGAPGTPIFGEAEARKAGFCGQVVAVIWRADRQRIIRELVVAYSDEGCL